MNYTVSSPSQAFHIKLGGYYDEIILPTAFQGRKLGLETKESLFIEKFSIPGKAVLYCTSSVGQSD